MIKTSILFENNDNNNMIPEGLVLSSLASWTPCHLDMDPVKLRSPGPQRGTQDFHKAWLSNVQCTHRLPLMPPPQEHSQSGLSALPWAVQMSRRCLLLRSGWQTRQVSGLCLLDSCQTGLGFLLAHSRP